MKVFLDVGAHHGQTLEAVQGRFDRVHCFEPVSECWPYLKEMADARTRIERFGLWNQTARMPLFDPGTQGAGLWMKDKRQPLRPVMTEFCELRRASEWFSENVSGDDMVYLKLNCEGCECDILDDLLDSGEFSKVTYAMVDFDARKIAALRHRPAQIMERLKAYPAPRISVSKQVMLGDTHAARIRHWLSTLPARA